MFQQRTETLGRKQLLVSKGTHLMRGYVAVIYETCKSRFDIKHETLALQTVNLASPPQPHLIMYPYIEVPFYSYAYKILKHFYASQEIRKAHTDCHYTNKQTNNMHMKTVTFVAGQQTFTTCQIYENFYIENKSPFHWRNAERSKTALKIKHLQFGPSLIIDNKYFSLSCKPKTRVHLHRTQIYYTYICKACTQQHVKTNISTS